jgi:hypothetical protein
MAVEDAVKKYGKPSCSKTFVPSTESIIGNVVRIAPNELVFSNPQAMTGIRYNAFGSSC